MQLDNSSEEEPKLIKGMSAVSFQESTVVYNIDTAASPKLNNDDSNIIRPPNKTEKGNLFRTILKRSLPKIKCISTFATLHENVQNNGLRLKAQMEEKEALRIIEETPVEIVDSRSNSRLKSASRRMSKFKRPKRCASQSSLLTSPTNAMCSKSELVKSFINNGKKDNQDGQKKTKKKNGKKKKNREKSYFCDPIIINTRVNHHEIVTPGTLECIGIQQTLAANGVTVSLNTLKRALLPPSEIRSDRYELSHCRLPEDNCSRLLSHPSAWLPKEYARLRSARKRLEEFDEETIRQSTVITSDDEDSGSSGETPKRSSSSRTSYNAFARTATTLSQKKRQSMKDITTQPGNVESSPSMQRATKVLSKWKITRRPSTAI